MTTLAKWFDKYAKLPLLRLLIGAVVLQVVYLTYFAYSRYSGQMERMRQLEDTVLLGVQQANRSLIESVFLTELSNTDVVAMLLCSGGRASISYPPSQTAVCEHPVHNLHRWTIRRKLTGIDRLDLMFVISPINIFKPLLLVMSMMICAMAVVVFTISRLRRKFEIEVLAPLSAGLGTDLPIPIKELDELRLKNLEYIRLNREMYASEVLVNLSVQVAHDIRSPLAALDMAVKNTADMPEEQRLVIRNASNRIRDIANNLIEKYRRPGAAQVVSSASSGTVVCLLSGLLDPLLTEKRLQFQSKPGVQLDMPLSSESYGLFASVQSVEFRRVVSNLVNNAVESLGDKGTISLRLAHAGGNISISISDNGKGIPPDILAKLGQKGETHGKAGGSGLGLYHARTTVESWGGTLSIASDVGKGTTVTLTLPATAPPQWFVPELAFEAGQPVVLLDDDPTIHQVWKGRFASSRVHEYDVEPINFTEPAQLRQWVAVNHDKAKTAIYLLDYELLGHKETGFSLAQELGLAGRAILVTSRWEEPQILAECRSIGLRLLPKNLSGLVPIRVSARRSAPAQAILLDDDPLVHMTWKIAAKSGGVELKPFKTAADLLAQAAMLDKKTPVYIDSELGAGVKGEDIARQLHEAGFTNLYMETGHPPEEFAKLTFLKGVISKDPPWQQL